MQQIDSTHLQRRSQNEKQIRLLGIQGIIIEPRRQPLSEKHDVWFDDALRKTKPTIKINSKSMKPVVQPKISSEFRSVKVRVCR